MKKKLFLVLLLILCVGCLFACSDDDSDDGENERGTKRDETLTQKDADAIYAILSAAEATIVEPGFFPYSEAEFTVTVKNGIASFDYFGEMSCSKQEFMEEWNLLAETENSEYAIQSDTLKESSVTFVGEMTMNADITWSATGDVDVLKGYNDYLTNILYNSKTNNSTPEATEPPTPEATPTPTPIPYVDVNPFDFIEVEFTGISPQMKAEVKVLDTIKSVEGANWIDFELDKSGCLRTGDTVTVSAEFSDRDAEKYHLQLTSSTKEYVVTGNAHYIATVDEIPKKALDEMIQTTTNYLTAKYANSHTDLISTEYYGTYVLNLKHPEKQNSFWGIRNNYVYVIVKGHLVGDEGTEGDVYYYGLWYDFAMMNETEWNLSIDADMENIDQQGLDKLDGYYLYGTTHEDSIYKHRVLAEVDNYDISTDIVKE